MRLLAPLALCLALAACAAGDGPKIVTVSPDDPTWPLNPGMWRDTGNAIDRAPVDSPVLTTAVGR